jgi:hypothetical protein
MRNEECKSRPHVGVLTPRFDPTHDGKQEQ